MAQKWLCRNRFGNAVWLTVCEIVRLHVCVCVCVSVRMCVWCVCVCAVCVCAVCLRSVCVCVCVHMHICVCIYECLHSWACIYDCTEKQAPVFLCVFYSCIYNILVDMHICFLPWKRKNKSFKNWRMEFDYNYSQKDAWKNLKPFFLFLFFTFCLFFAFCVSVDFDL